MITTSPSQIVRLTIDSSAIVPNLLLETGHPPPLTKLAYYVYVEENAGPFDGRINGKFPVATLLTFTIIAKPPTPNDRIIWFVSHCRRTI